MISIFSRKKNNIELTYGISQEGLKCLEKALSEYNAHCYSSVFLNEFDSDMQYLLGIADTLPERGRVISIVRKVSDLRNTLLCNIRVSEKAIDDE